MLGPNAGLLQGEMFVLQLQQELGAGKAGGVFHVSVCDGENSPSLPIGSVSSPRGPEDPQGSGVGLCPHLLVWECSLKGAQLWESPLGQPGGLLSSLKHAEVSGEGFRRLNLGCSCAGTGAGVQ